MVAQVVSMVVASTVVTLNAVNIHVGNLVAVSTVGNFGEYSERGGYGDYRD